MTANRLSHAHSAYLRQHAENPVDWWEWSDEAFAEARRRDVPVFLSVGYAACHWCHVMAHESFEDEHVADYLNQYFVAIKVDREERPDVDAIYMAATQSISGHGGWPMSVFLRPDGKAFMAGTYYPPEDRHGQPGFLRLLSAIQDGWTNQRHLIDQQTDEVSRAIEHEIAVVDRLAPATSNALEGVAQNLRTKLVASFHPAGGFSRAPKFPRPSYVNALLPFLDEPDVHHVVTVTLDQMSRRGLYDHIEGGFARYSVDDSWHVPHFEKMLSDQALLARVYLRADRAAGGQTPWRDVARDTLRFVVRDLALPHGYASSLDADSNGHEGAHATWTREQLVEALTAANCLDLLGEVMRRWELDGTVLFEGTSIPQLAPDEPFVTPLNLQPALTALRAARRQRIQPGRDEKVILEWNAMLAVALLESDEVEFFEPALLLLDALPKTHFTNGRWWRTDGRQALASAADLGWWAQALLAAYQRTGVDAYLDQAGEVIAYLENHYVDGDLVSGGGVFSTSDLATDLPWRPKDLFDGATPSGHAVVTMALAQYATLAGDARMSQAAEHFVALAHTVVTEHPTAVPDLVEAALQLSEGVELVTPGPRNELTLIARELYVPGALLVCGEGRSELLAGRTAGLAYLCRHQTCERPTDSPETWRAQLASVVKERAQ